MADPMQEIEAERRRQIDVEGWTPEHDDQHERGHMLRAAVIYLWHGTEKAAPLNAAGAPLGWPWEPQWFKPKDRRSNLIRAGALCLAERQAIERRHARSVKWRDHLISHGKTSQRPIRSAAYTGHVDHKLEIIVRELEALAGQEDSPNVRG